MMACGGVEIQCRPVRRLVCYGESIKIRQPNFAGDKLGNFAIKHVSVGSFSLGFRQSIQSGSIVGVTPDENYLKFPCVRTVSRCRNDAIDSCR